MDAKILNQFILATSQVFQQVANLPLKKEQVNYYESGHKFRANVATLIGFSGHLKGQLVVAIEETMAMKFASAIMMGVPVEEYNELAESGVCEMSNMIGGEALRRLQEAGYPCELSIPSIIRGKDIEIGFFPKASIFAVDFSCDWGKITLIMRCEDPKLSPAPSGSTPE